MNIVHSGIYFIYTDKYINILVLCLVYIYF